MPPASSDLALAFQLVLAVLEELGGGGVERQHEVLARLVARLLDRLHDEVQRLVGRGEVGREAALVADVGVVAGVLAAGLFSAWKISAPMRSASAKVWRPIGMIMNSWMSIGLSACAPPLMMFIIGTGSSGPETPPT